MDIFAHSLWTNAIYKKAADSRKVVRSKWDIWSAVWWGIAPDILAFAPYVIVSIFGTGALWHYAEARVSNQWHLTGRFGGPPDPSMIPSYVYLLYSFTHSLLIFLAVFALVWIIRKRPYWPLAAWGLHIGIDIWSHTGRFFPTPLFFPFSNYHFNGISWGDPVFMLVNYSLLATVYLWFYRTEIVSYIKRR